MSFTLPAPQRGGASRRIGLALALAIGSAVATPSTGVAAPIVPSAAPLMADLPAYPAACPRPGELDGTLATDLLQKAVRRDEIDLVGISYGLETLPAPAVFVCDPVAAGARRLLGPITGSAAQPVTQDLAWFGSRGLVLGSSGSRVPSLTPGDRLVLPSVSAGSQLTVSVSTPGGARTVLVPPAEAAPTAVAIEGSAATPTLVVERGEAPATRVPVETRPSRAVRVRASASGSTLTFRGTAASRTVVIALSEGSKRARADATVVRATARIPKLTLPRLTPEHRTARVVAINLETRRTTISHCKLRWQAQRLEGARCSTNLSSLVEAAPVGALLSAPASESLGPLLLGDTDGAASPQRAVPPPRVRAARAPKLATVEATVTEVARQDAQVSASLTPSDMNGDGRPDFFVDDSFSGPRNKPFLLTSTPGAWSRVPFLFPSGRDLQVYPDIDGDGLGDLRAFSGTFVTDALAAPRASQIDLRKGRAPSPRDLDLGTSNAPLFGALQVFAEPFGALADVTGDGRAELAFSVGGTLVYASESIVPGRRSKLADFAPVGFFGDPFGGPEFSTSSGGAEDATEEDQQLGISSLIAAQRLVTLRPSDFNRRPNVARPIEIRTANASGAVLGTTSFLATGVARIVDHDPASGASLVVLNELGPCRNASDVYARQKAKPRKRCTDRLVRIASDGTVSATVTLPRLQDESISGRFITDGPDADGLLDVAMTAGTSASTAPEVVPTRPTDGGTVAILTSTRTGSLAVTDLPVLAERGVILQSVIGYSSSQTADGNRWLAGGFQTVTEANSFRALDDLEQRLALVTQAP